MIDRNDPSVAAFLKATSNLPVPDFFKAPATLKDLETAAAKSPSGSLLQALVFPLDASGIELIAQEHAAMPTEGATAKVDRSEAATKARCQSIINRCLAEIDACYGALKSQLDSHTGQVVQDRERGELASLLVESGDRLKIEWQEQRQKYSSDEFRKGITEMLEGLSDEQWRQPDPATETDFGVFVAPEHSSILQKTMRQVVDLCRQTLPAEVPSVSTADSSEPQPPKYHTPDPPDSWTDDFITCQWHGKPYTFRSEDQQSIIRSIWHRRRRGQLRVPKEQLDVSGKKYSLRVSQVFRGHPAWRVMVGPAIDESGKELLGEYALYDPPGTGLKQNADRPNDRGNLARPKRKTKNLSKRGGNGKKTARRAQIAPKLRP